MADAAALVELVGRETISPAAASASRALDGFNAAAGRVGGAVASMAAATAKAALAIGAIGTAASAAFAGSAVKTAADFEKTVSGIGAVANLSAQQMQAVSSVALQIGKDTKFGASEAAAGIEELVKAGVSIQDVMAGAARSTADLAAASGTDLKTAAEVASNAMTSFNKTGADMAGLANTITGAVNASAIDIGDFKFSLASVGAVAASVGLSFEDTATAIALMGNAGIKGSDAGTSLKTMFLNLQPATKAQKEEFQRLGLITEAGANAFFTAEGKAKGLAEIAGVLQDATKGMTDQQKLASLEILFGSDAIRAATILTKAGAEGFRDLGQQMAGMDAGEQGRKRLDNLAGSMEQLSGTWETIRISMGRPFLPVLKRGVDALADALDKAEPTLTAFAERAAAGLDTLLTRAQAAAPALVAAGTTALAFGRNLLSLARGAIPTLVRAFDQVRDLFGSEAAGAAAGGLTRFVAQVQQGFRTLLPVAQAVGRGLVTYVIDTFRFLTDRVLPPVLSILDQTGQVFLGTLLPSFQTTGAVLRGIFGDTLDWLAKTVWPPFLSIVEQTADFFTTTILPTLPAVSQSLRTALGETVQWLADDVWPKLTTAAGVAWGFISGTIVPALPGFAQQVRELLGGALTWVGETGWPALVKGADVAWRFLSEKVIPIVQDLIGWLKEKVPPAVAGVVSAFEAVRSRLAPVVEAVFSGDIKTALSKLGSAFADFASLAVGWLGEQAGKIQWASVWAQAKDVVTGMAQWFGGLATQLATWIGQQVDTVQWAAVWARARDVVVGMAQWFADVATRFAGWIGERVAAIAWGSVWAQAKDVIAGTAQWFVTIVTDWATWIGERVAAIDWASVWAQAKDVVTGMAQWFGTVATVFATWLGEQVRKIQWGSVWSSIQGMTEAMQKAFEEQSAKLDWKAITTANKDMSRQMAEGLNEQIRQADWTSVGASFADALFGGVGGAGGVIGRAWRDGWKNLPATHFFEPLDAWVRAFDWHAADVALAQAFVGFLNRAWDIATGGWRPRLPDWLFPPPGGVPADWAPWPRQGPTNATPSGGNVMSAPAYGNEWEREAYAAAVRAGHPDPVQFVEQMRLESANFAPDVIAGRRASSAGALGIAQIMPGVAAGAGVDPLDPAAALAYAATRMAQNYQRYGGNADLALAEYNMGAGNLQRFGPRGLSETNQYIDRIIGRTNEARQNLAAQTATPSGLPDQLEIRHKGTGAISRISRSLWETQMTNRDEFEILNALPAAPAAARPTFDPAGLQAFRQTQQQWSQMAADANAICGPFLASLFADAVGRPPTPEEARSLAEKMGIYSGAGGGSGILSAAGFDEYATALIQQINPGSSARVTQTPVSSAAEAARMAQEALAGGSPLIGINTPAHYFGADAFNAATGQFHVGGTGLSLAGGAEWMTIDEIVQKGQGLISVLTLVGESGAAATVALQPMPDALRGVTAATVDTQAGVTATAEAVSGATDTITASFDLMASGALSSVTSMGDGILTTMQDTAGNTIATVTDLAGNVTSQSATLANGVSLNLADMAVKSTQSVDELAGAITTTMTDAAGNAVTTVTNMQGQVVGQFATMQAQAGSAVATLAQTAGREFGNVAQAADTIPSAVGRVNDSFKNIKPPKLDGVIRAFEEVAETIEDAVTAADEFADKTGIKSGSGKANPFAKRASGGPVTAGVPYVVGDGGRPELFVPRTDGYILPRVPAGFGGSDGGIDEERLARLVAEAVARAVSRPHITVSGVGLDEVADEIARREHIESILRGGELG